MTTPKVLHPSQVIRMTKAGKLADPQPRGAMRIMCEEHRHLTHYDTESPTFWENGSYMFCPTCKAWKLARIVGPDFEIDLTGERKKYPLTMEHP